MREEVKPHGLLFRWLWLPLARVFAFFLLLVLGPVRVYGRWRVPAKGPLLILANHQSLSDPIVLYYACRRPVYFMARRELFAMKGIGPVIRFFKAFPVTQSSADKEAIRTAVAYLKAGEAVCVFPEGGVSDTGGLKELKPGASLLVRMSGATVICAGLQNTRFIIPYESTSPRMARRWVTVRWGEPKRFSSEVSSEEFVAWVESEFRRLTT